MKTPEEYTKNFMEKLKNGELKKDNLPNNGPTLTMDYVKKENASFRDLLQSETSKKIMKLF